MNMAEKLDVVKRPQNWDKAVSVAYLRLLSCSQEGAAQGAGIGVRTLRRYELPDWWPQACSEAVGRWMQQLEIEARTTVMAAVKEGDVVTAMKVLERLDPQLSPPRKRYEHTGPDGGPVETKNVRIYLPENHRNRVNGSESRASQVPRKHG